jgi:predicted RNA binding protein YcfA (HicA-like mRNA interferase family)
MTGIPQVSSTKLIKAFLSIGFGYAPHRGKGSHTALYRIDPQGVKRLVIIPKRDPLPTGTLHSIMKQAGMSREEFIELLER